MERLMYTTFDVVEKYQARLNKSDSQDYDNIWWYQIEETFYKGMLEVIRKLKRGISIKKDGDENTTDRVDDLQSLLKQQSISVTEKELFAQSLKLPSDYLYFKRLSPKCTKGSCNGINIKSYLREEANVDDLLGDANSQPSFDFEQTFHTMIGNKFRVYHNKDFKVDEIDLIYYRYPTKYKFDKSKEIPIDFKDDVVELFIDEGIKIMSGDIGDIQNLQIAEKRSAEIL